jgi:hypothetical protein
VKKQEKSINRAFAYMMSQIVKMGVGQQVNTTHFYVEAIDLLSNHVPSETGIALVVAVYSAIKRQSVQAGLVILGDLSIQGNIKSVHSLAEPLQVAMDNGAPAGLGAMENKRHFLEVSADIVERVDPIFFSDPMTAAMKALGGSRAVHPAVAGVSAMNTRFSMDCIFVDPKHRRLLRPRRERPGCRAAEQRDEVAPPQVDHEAYSSRLSQPTTEGTTGPWAVNPL